MTTTSQLHYKLVTNFPLKFELQAVQLLQYPISGTTFIITIKQTTLAT